jgi:hypothetical protein
MDVGRVDLWHCGSGENGAGCAIVAVALRMPSPKRCGFISRNSRTSVRDLSVAIVLRPMGK